MTGRTAVLLAGVLALVVVGLVRVNAGDRPTELSQTGLPPTSPSEEDARPSGEPTVPPLTAEPDIQVANHPFACRSTALAGQALEGTQYPVLTEPGRATRVDWTLDGVTLGSSRSAPFLPLDAAGVPVPIDARALPHGPHDVVALVHEDLAPTRRLYASFVTMGSGPSPTEAATITAGAPGGPMTPLAAWTVLRGQVTFSAATTEGEPLVVEVDGRRPPGPLDADALAPGRHRVTAALPGATGGGPVVERTVVTTGGRPVPEACAPVDVRSYGAIVDGVSDDTDAVVAAVEVAMASGATVSFPAGTHAVPNLKNVVLSRDVAFTGAEGAILDGKRPGEKYTMFSIDANVSFTGISVRNAGKLFSFDKVSRRIDRFTIERSSFADVYSPAHTSEPPPQSVDNIRIIDNKVERAVKGFYLPLKLISHALVQDNVLESVGDAAIRLGSDTDSSFSVQQNIDVRENRIHHVTGESDANGIKVLGVDSLIVDNEVSDIASTDGTDSEGIYTKGHGHVIAGNRLHDAGRTQAQIAVKSDSTTVSRNTIVTESTATNGIRIEGSNVTVKDNHLRGGLVESIGITTKLTAGFGGYVFEGNEIVDTDGIGISTGGDGPVVIRANQFKELRGSTAVEVKATRADTVNVQIVQNVVEPMVNPGSRAFLLGARSGHGMTDVRILDNRITDAVTALAFDVEKDARVTDVVTAGNGWNSLRGEALVGEERVDGFTNG